MKGLLTNWGHIAAFTGMAMSTEMPHEEAIYKSLRSLSVSYMLRCVMIQMLHHLFNLASLVLPLQNQLFPWNCP